jgi:hypothetical protein
VGATLAISGTALARAYVTAVLPRAALYGEGGTEAMLLEDLPRNPQKGSEPGASPTSPDANRFPADGGGGREGEVTLDGVSYREAIWSFPAAASLPRLLAPSAPTPVSAIAPYLATAAALAWAARRRAGAASEGLFLFAGATACVVTSPAGWAMGLVWALPLAPLVLERRAAGGVSTPAPAALAPVAAAWLACAIPAPFSGFPALAGAALVVAVVATVQPASAG